MARKQKTKRTKSRKKQTERNIVTDSKIREEIVLIMTCLFSFLLFFSNLGFCGFLGEILVKIQFFFFVSFSSSFFTAFFYGTEGKSNGLSQNLFYHHFLSFSGKLYRNDIFGERNSL